MGTGYHLVAREEIEMDFGVCVATKIDDIDYIAHAEQLGYTPG